MLVALKNTPASFTVHSMSYYVLDDWKATPKLTINAGLRYEYQSFPEEAHGDTPVWDGSLGNGVGGLLYPSQNTTAKPFYQNDRPDLPFGFLNRKTMMLPDWRDFAPRLGFAYRPFHNTKTVIRGGYGWYYARPDMPNLLSDSTSDPPGTLWPTFTGNPVAPNLTWNGLAGVPPSDAFKTFTFGIIGTHGEQQWLDGYIQQWSLSVGRELAQNTSLQVQYLGSESTHLNNYYPINWTEPAPGPVQPRLPWPKWGRIFGFSSGGDANYNGLLVSLQHRYSNGLDINADYTYSKAIADKGAEMYAGDIGLVQDPGNLAAERYVTSDDVPNRFTLSYVYALPVGPGKAFGSGLHGFAGKLLEGWQVSGVTTFATGFPLLGPTISSANCNAGPEIFCRPDLIGNPILGGSGVNSPKFNVAAFDWPLKPTHPAENPRFGNSAWGILRGNGTNLWNLALLKDTRFKERYDVQFRFETFNTWNHPNFGNPVASPGSPLFGRTFSAGDPREIQFGLKFYW